MRGYLSGLLLAGLCLLVAGGAPGGPRPAHAISTSVVVNEVFNSNATSPPGSQNEYFELMNISNSTVDLSTYFIYNKNGRDSLAGVPNPVMLPGEIRVIPATQLPGGDIGVGTIFSGINVGLDTSADYVGLANSIPTDTAIDAVNWGTLNPNWFAYALFNLEYIRDGAVPIPVPDIGKSLQRFPDGR